MAMTLDTGEGKAALTLDTGEGKAAAPVGSAIAEVTDLRTRRVGPGEGDRGLTELEDLAC